MSRVGRLGGALLAETNGEFYLVGNTKVPVAYEEHGFEKPSLVDAMVNPYIALTKRGEPHVAPPFLTLDVEDEALASLLAERLLIERNASVSDRLWRLLLNPAAPQEEISGESVDVTWFGQMPKQVWDVVRDTVLKCT
jgi:hypothetical protein